MDFGPFGASELLFIALLALVVFGPRRLAEVGRTVGGVLTRLRRATHELRSAFESELDQVDGAKDIKNLTNEVRQAGHDLRGLGRDLVGRAAGGVEDDPSQEDGVSRGGASVRSELRSLGDDMREASRQVKRALEGSEPAAANDKSKDSGPDGQAGGGEGHRKDGNVDGD